MSCLLFICAAPWLQPHSLQETTPFVMTLLLPLTLPHPALQSHAGTLQLPPTCVNALRHILLQASSQSSRPINEDASASAAASNNGGTGKP